MKKILTMCLLFTLMAGSLFFVASATPVKAEAGDIMGNLTDVGGGMGENATGNDLPATIGAIINVVLGLVGIILVVLIVYAGFLYMTSGGDTKGVDKATTMIKNAVIGLIITISAYAIATYVIQNIQDSIK